MNAETGCRVACGEGTAAVDAAGEGGSLGAADWIETDKALPTSTSGQNHDSICGITEEGGRAENPYAIAMKMGWPALLTKYATPMPF